MAMYPACFIVMLMCVCAGQVTLEGIPKNPEEQDDYYKNKGPIPKFSNEYGCITDVVKYVVNESALGEYCPRHHLLSSL